MHPTIYKASLMRIEHINITVPLDLLERVKEFYCTVFGLVDGYRPKFSRAGYWLYSDCDPIIHLTASDAGKVSRDTGYFDHFAIQTTGLTAVISCLQELQIKYSIEHLHDIGMTQLFFKDPAGVGVEANFKEESGI